MADRQRERSRSRERHRRRSRDNHGDRDHHDRRHRSRERGNALGERRDRGRDGDRRHVRRAPDERHRDADAGRSQHSRHGGDRHGRADRGGGRADGDGHRSRRADAHDGGNMRPPVDGAAVLDAMVPEKAAAHSGDAKADAGMPHSQIANGRAARRTMQQPPVQQPPAAPAPAADQQQGAQQPVRINPQGIYARAIEEYDYVVPRGGYFFEHDDRDVITFKEEMQRPRNGAAAPGHPAAAGAAVPGRSFVAEDPSDRWEESRRPPPRQHGRDWADSEAAEPMGRERLGRRGGASEGIFGRHRGGDDRGGSDRYGGRGRMGGGAAPWDHGGRGGGWHGGRGGGGGGGFGGGGKWAHDMFETLAAEPENHQPKQHQQQPVASKVKL